MLPRLRKMWHLSRHANVTSRHRLTNRSELLSCWLHELRRLLWRTHWPKLHRHWWSKILWSTRTHHWRPGMLRRPRRLHITRHQTTSNNDKKWEELLPKIMTINSVRRTGTDAPRRRRGPDRGFRARG
uniref:Protein binding protein, putative n=1 Tax=Arundo donax TaxID=35708 RepID=A0A0A9D899_ARUDO